MQIKSDSVSKDNAPNTQVKIVYLHRSPELHPRTDKIRQSLVKNGFEFEVFKPRITFKSKSRILSSILNYSIFFIQSLFIKGDIIWVANCPDTVGLGPWLSSRKYIYDYRSPWSKEVELEFGKGFLSKVAGKIERQMRKRAEAIVVVSSRMQKDVEGLRKPVFLVPNYPTRDFVPTKVMQAMRELVGVSPGKQIVLFVGKLSRVEGADMLPNIFEELKKSPSIELWIVGDGPLRTEIEELQKRYLRRVRYFGWVNYSEIPNYIAAANVCIVPRHKNPFSDYYNEQGVQKIAEYIALGKSVVACNIAESLNYVLVDEGSFAQGILDALTYVPQHKEIGRFWEDHSEPTLIEAINNVLSYNKNNNDVIARGSQARF